MTTCPSDRIEFECGAKILKRERGGVCSSHECLSSSRSSRGTRIPFDIIGPLLSLLRRCGISTKCEKWMWFVSRNVQFGNSSSRFKKSEPASLASSCISSNFHTQRLMRKETSHLRMHCPKTNLLYTHFDALHTVTFFLMQNVRTNLLCDVDNDIALGKSLPTITEYLVWLLSWALWKRAPNRISHFESDDSCPAALV